MKHVFLNTIRCMRLPFLVSLALLTACGSCIVGAIRNTTTESDRTAPSADAGASANRNSGQAATPPAASTPVVPAETPADAYIKKLSEFLAQKGYQEALGLFSEGGFAGVGNGQTMLLQSDTGVWTMWHTRTSDEPKDVNAFKPAPQSATADLVKVVPDFYKLENISVNAFDAFTYVYVNLKKNGAGQVERAKTLTIRNLISDRPEAKPYNDLLAAFRSLTTPN